MKAAVSSVLVAGVGNVFLGDDGFGPVVARRLAEEVSGAPGWAPEDLRVCDYGVRGLHLAYDLLDGVDALVLVDALPAPADGSAAAGTLRILQIRAGDLEKRGPTTQTRLPLNPGFDPHGMDPLAVLRGLLALGGSLPLTFLVGCIAGRTEEGMELSEDVSRAVPAAAAAVRTLVTTRIPAAVAASAETASAEPAGTGRGGTAHVLGYTGPDH